MSRVEHETIGSVVCPWRAIEGCNVTDPPDERCCLCDRYADLLQSVRALYRDRAWAVTPEGVLQEVG